MTPLIDAAGLSLPGRLQPTDLRMEGPALVALIGPNGGGKTSLLRALAGAEDASGLVRIAGEDLGSATPVRRSQLIGYLPASRDLRWPIVVRDVIRLSAAPPEEDRMEDLLDALDLRSLADRPIDALSTGERSRVLLARALAPSPALVLLDEPLANLDPFWVLRTLDLIRDAAAQGSAVILSIHDLSRLEVFDRLLLMNDGGLIADGPPLQVASSVRFADAFGVVRDGSGWRIRRPEDRRSSP